MKMWLKRRGVHNPRGLLIGQPAASLKGTQKSALSPIYAATRP